MSSEPLTEDIVKLITLIFTKKNFSFNNEHCVHLKGTAMGTCMAPLYANIFMDNLERRMLANTDAISSTWWRYIYDISAIWSHGEEQLTEFLEKVNQFHPSSKFTVKWPMKFVAFLDTTVSVDNEGCLTTNLCVKPTNTHQYLRSHSCHPSHCKRGILFSQALRIQRICTKREDCPWKTQTLKGYLVNCKYNEDEIQYQIDNTAGLDREALLHSKKVKTPLERVPLIVTYHLGLPSLKSILHKHSYILNVFEN